VSDDDALAAAEDWFVRHGLPYFVDDLRAQARRGLSRPVFLPVFAVAVGIGVVIGLLAPGDASESILTAVVAWLAVLVVYGFARLKVRPMARWAVSRTFTSLGLLFPLVTRALPLLLLFVTFLFVNTEVWQVASHLDNGVLWVAVLLFAGVAVGFLLVRLPEELDQVDDEIGGQRLVAACQSTPLDDFAPRYADQDVTEIAQVHGFEKGNLVFVLLVSQTVQVLLLSLAVYGFFVVFGCVAISRPVMEAWLGGPEEIHWVVPGWHVLSWELLQVSTFLAAFAGLYFTVYAVSDENYRKQFFDSLMQELERAVGVRAVYRMLSR
jgi:hypothetical protein